MIDIRPATPADVEAVLANLSDQNRAEYETIGFPGPKFDERWRAFCNAAMSIDCMWFDGEPQAFMAIARDGDGIPCTWLGVTKAFFDKGAAPIRSGRRYMAERVARFGPIVSYLTSPHPNLNRWVKLFGARQAVDGPVKVFVFDL